MKEIKNHYHNLVIGFGKGGKTLAAFLAKKGQDVVVIERSEREMGEGSSTLPRVRNRHKHQFITKR